MAVKMRARGRQPVSASTSGGTPPLARESLAHRIEQLHVLDVPAEQLQKAVRKLVPAGPAKDLLSGTWLGHPVHPPLTDLVVGSWTSAWLLDALGGTRARPAARRLIGIGIVAAVPTAAAGLSDWAELRTGPRRVGMIHALGNTTALTLHVFSWRARGRGRHGAGVALSTLGIATATFSAWLGGHLSFGRGVGVDQTAFDELPQDWTAVAEESDLEDGRARRAIAGETAVVLVREGATLHALADRCSHRGCSLSEGTVEDGAITCRCHGSRFRLDGRVVRGPATAPQPALEVRVRAGRVEVRARPDA
jgi:nitrite reductase/ring-hydroxylating ferredoxin subunit/uncharacterized membrane protein